MNAKVLSVVLTASLFVAFAVAGPVVGDEKGHIENSVHTGESTIEESLLKKLNTKCSNRDISSCMMLKLVTYFNKMLKKSSIEIGDVEITQTTSESIVVDNPRSLNEFEGMSQEAQVGEVIMDKFYSFLKTRSLKWKALDGADVVISGNSGKDGSLNLDLSLRPNESTNGDARRRKGDNGMGTMMAAAIMKIGLLKALAFKALVLLVGKALLVSKLALVLAAVIGLKKLFSQEKHVTYEVVAHPSHHEHHDHESYSGGGGGWGRNFETAQNMAYRGQIPQN